MKIEIVKARGGWKWQIVANNNAVLARSAKAIVRKRNAVAAAKKMQAGVAKAEIVVREA